MDMQHARVAFAFLEARREHDEGVEVRAVFHGVSVFFHGAARNARHKILIDGAERLQSFVIKAKYLGRQLRTGYDGKDSAIECDIKLADDIFPGDDPLHFAGCDIYADKLLLTAIFDNRKNASAVR